MLAGGFILAELVGLLQLVGTPAGPGDIQNPATIAGFTRDTRLSTS